MEIEIINDTLKSEKTICIKPRESVKIMFVILDVILVVVGVIVLIAFFLFSLIIKIVLPWWGFSIILSFIVLILILHLVLLTPKVALTKNNLDESIILQKQFIFKMKPKIYQSNESPYLKLMKPPVPVGDIFYFLIIQSNQKKDILRPLEIFFRQDGWTYTKEEAQKIAGALNIKISDKVEDFSIF
jgi:hypothetical protein